MKFSERIKAMAVIGAIFILIMSLVEGFFALRLPWFDFLIRNPLGLVILYVILWIVAPVFVRIFNIKIGK